MGKIPIIYQQSTLLLSPKTSEVTTFSRSITIISPNPMGAVTGSCLLGTGRPTGLHVLGSLDHVAVEQALDHVLKSVSTSMSFLQIARRPITKSSSACFHFFGGKVDRARASSRDPPRLLRSRDVP